MSSVHLRGREREWEGEEGGEGMCACVHAKKNTQT